jgi:hypothetical protein
MLIRWWKSVAAAMRERQGIDKLILTGWRGSLLATCGFLIVTFFAFGFWWPYWRAGDMDIWIVYSVFALNDGLPQAYDDHPGYLTILLVTGWFKLLHMSGWLPAYALSQLPPETDVISSSQAWMNAVQAARFLSLLIGLAIALTFASLLRRLIGNWRIAALAFFFLVCSGGFMMEVRIVRTELIAAGFAYIALLLCLLAIRGKAGSYRPLLISAAAFLSMLALENKVQVVFLIATIPILVFALTEKSIEASKRWQSISGGAVALALILLAIVGVVAVWPMAQAGLFHPAVVAVRLNIFRTAFPVFQAALLSWIAVCMLVYPIWFRLGAIETIATLAGAVIGTCLAILVLDIKPHEVNVVAVTNPFERMFVWFEAGSAGKGVNTTAAILGQLLEGAGLVFARHTFVLSTSARPTIFLEWVLLAASIYAWRRGHRQVVLQVAMMMTVVLLIDFVGSMRNMKLEYFLFADPLVIIAMAHLLTQVSELQVHRYAYPTALILGVATVAIGLAEPVKHTFKTDKPMDFCIPHATYTPTVELLPFCRQS